MKSDRNSAHARGKYELRKSKHQKKDFEGISLVEKLLLLTFGLFRATK